MMWIVRFDASHFRMLLPFGVTVALVLFGPQAETPAFRAEAYIIPFYVTLSHGKKPITDLTVANFKIVVDKKIYVPVDFEQDSDKPGPLCRELQAVGRPSRRHGRQRRSENGERPSSFFRQVPDYDTQINRGTASIGGADPATL
jgi:hypothetical protein